ncbi:DegQ family serine endoprotease [Geomesophilobacter sediminis]|uniref:Probable periplasmic serine endoprotease DegP-like n=1 Tax=Geomesophilobacter sediminis TaxID=2798584 RepID=A0A8J7J5J8_9BACT|nr:DegQ family serine endoprotease [Geomesophilobacter sediminis]MBJ6726283.1 DegQ family serine endoprotease [Geomesophilobacter sediminis]
MATHNFPCTFFRTGTLIILGIWLHLVALSVPAGAQVGFPHSFADLAERVRPSVVNISSTTTVKVPGNPFRHYFGDRDGGNFDEFFKHFFGDTPDREMKQQSLGSGVIVSRDGYILTNNHVVEGTGEIKVKLSDGRELKARVIGRDPKTDLALIKVTSGFENLPVLTLGDSEKMRVGDWVLAVGNPFGLELTVTQGIISATGRVIGSGPYDNFLQTDAPINPGNSGGPLVNLRGEVVGINTAIVSGGQGIGFAIPSDLAKSVMTQLREKGKVTRGWIGVSIQSVTPEIAKAFGMKDTRGALVGDVIPEGPAARAGIKRGDIILAFDGRPVKSSNDLPRVVAETAVGKQVEVTILRDKKEIRTPVKVAELTDARAATGEAPAEGYGMKLSNLDDQLRERFGLTENAGVVVTDVASGSVADDAGIEAGDVIKEVNRVPVRNLAQYQEQIRKGTSGEPVLLLVQRGKETFYVSLQAP